MLSTSDNPYNPWTEFDQWRTWDEQSEYHTLSYLARVTITSHELSELDEAQAVDQAIQEILDHNITGKYIKVAPPAEMLTTS
jgi:hypothetical protein